VLRNSPPLWYDIMKLLIAIVSDQPVVSFRIRLPFVSDLSIKMSEAADENRYLYAGSLYSCINAPESEGRS
jgi:hypothetical protein